MLRLFGAGAVAYAASLLSGYAFISVMRGLPVGLQPHGGSSFTMLAALNVLVFFSVLGIGAYFHTLDRLEQGATTMRAASEVFLGVVVFTFGSFFLVPILHPVSCILVFCGVADQSLVINHLVF